MSVSQSQLEEMVESIKPYEETNEINVTPPTSTFSNQIVVSPDRQNVIPPVIKNQIIGLAEKKGLTVTYYDKEEEIHISLY